MRFILKVYKRMFRNNILYVYNYREKITLSGKKKGHNNVASLREFRHFCELVA